ncbi:MAG: IS66 family transposase [Bdellovibrionales bacterium]|nr:IS66 family transposase [Bdellovibrionales bacterium]
MSMLVSSDKIAEFAELQTAYLIATGELAAAKQEINRLQQEVYNLQRKQQESALEMASLKEEVARLMEQLLLLKKQKFGKSSEINPGETIILPGEDNFISDHDKSILVSSYSRQKPSKSRGRNIDLSTLPRYIIYHDLDDEHKNCICCNKPLVKIGQDVSEQLEVLPMRIYVIEHVRYKFACRDTQTIYMAPKPPAPIPKSLAGGSLLTEVIINKYQYHIPLYRQSKIFASYNVVIPDNTIGNWVMQSGRELIIKLAEAMWQAVLSVKYLQVDETPIKLLKPNKKGYLWAYFAPHIGQGLVVFELSETRSGSVAETRLANFTGLLQTDGYAGYNSLRKRKGITGFGCLTHCRRKFNDVLKITNNSKGVAAEVIARLKPLYALEKKMRDLKLNFHTRKRLRQKQAWPILKAMRPWLKQQLAKTPPKSKLGQAIEYMLNQWSYVTGYLRHGAAEIDTNWVENEIRPIALGKKNWLFMEGEKSGEVNAFWYSIVLSALLNEINPRVYIHFLLMKMHDLRLGKVDPMTLLPHTIDKNQLQEFADKQIAFGKQVLDSS